VNLPTWQSSDRVFQLMQNKWSAILNPLLAKPLSSSNILKDVELVMGVNKVNHLLGRTMQGWIISNIDASVIVYRSQPFNDKILTLTTNGACIVDIVVF